MRKFLSLLALMLLCSIGASAQTVIARMQDFVNAKTVGTMPSTVSEWTTSETGGGIYDFNGSTFIGGCALTDVDAAFKGSNIVTVAAWVYGLPGTDNCIFGYGEDQTGWKFMMSGKTFKATTKSKWDFETSTATTQIAANQWNLIAFAVPGSASTNTNIKYYASTTDGQLWTKNQITDGRKMATPSTNKSAVGSGNQGSAREAYNGMIANLIVIESSDFLQNSAIKTLIGDAPTKAVRPDYAINFDNAAHSHSSGGRKVTQLKLGDQTIDVDAGGNFYQNLYDSKTFTIPAGTSVKPQIIWDGSWMAGYVYVDKDASDKQFTVEELVSSTAGEGTHNFTTDLPAFTIEDPGTYHMRYKVDWNSTDPGGSSSIKDNGGYIFDVKLVVEAPENLTEVTYNYIYRGETLKTTTSTQTVGATVAAPSAIPFATLSYNETAVVTENMIVDVTVNDNLPFEVGEDFASIPKWYVLQVHSNMTYYPRYEATADAVSNVFLANEESDATGRSEYAWGFTGNLKDGFKLYNYVAGASLSLNDAISSSMAAEGYSFKLMPSGENGTGYFCLQQSNGKYINANSHDAAGNSTNNGRVNLNEWTANDAGSTFKVIPAVTPVTYVITNNFGEEVNLTVNQQVGGNAEIPALPYFTGNITDDNKVITYTNTTFHVTGTWNLPFEELKTYTMKSLDSSNGRNYVFDGNNSAWYNNSVAAADDNDLWIFEHVPNTLDLFMLKNYSSNKYGVLSATGRNALTFAETPSVWESGNGETSYFRLAEQTNGFNLAHPNDNTTCVGSHVDGKLGSWRGTSSPTNANSVNTVEYRRPLHPTDDEIAALQDEIDDLITNHMIGEVGYPTWYCQEVQTLMGGYCTNFEGGSHGGMVTIENYNDALKALNAFYSTTNVVMPEDGKAYTISNVTPNGSKRMLYYRNDGGMFNNYLRAAENNVTPGYEHTFYCRQVGENKFVFVNEMGIYVEFQSRLTRAAGETYDSNYNDFTFAKMVNDENPRAVFGAFSIYGTLYNVGSGYLTAISGSFNTPSSDLLFNDDDAGSTAFVLTEVENPNKVKVSSPNPTGKSSLDGKFVGTFSANYNVELRNGLKAYTAALSEDKQSVIFTLLGEDGTIVPKHTGVLVYAENADASITKDAIPAIATVDVTNNIFLPTNGGSVTINEGDLVLGNGNKGVGFYLINPDKRTVGRNKAYIPASSAAASAARFVFDFDVDGTLTGVDGVETCEGQCSVYDLQGRRVQNAQKGLYIVNGKKVVR